MSHSAATRETGYAVNLHSRIASRVLWQVGRRGYTNEQHLYDATQEVRWQDLMSAQQTLRVDVTASRSPLSQSGIRDAADQGRHRRSAARR